MVALQLPCTLFKTQKWMDDYSASDMRCGDLTEAQLKSHYGLVDVSTRANPYTLTKITPFNQPQSMFYGSRGEGGRSPRFIAHVLDLWPIQTPDRKDDHPYAVW